MGPYRLRDHARMFGNETRNRAYAAALDRVVAQGDVVLDIGTGTGLLAMLACKAGASHVYAVESSPIVAHARALAAHNGLEDRITFIEQSSLTLTLPERVHVIVSDVRGVLPLAANALASLIDARERFLQPGGRMVPAVDLVRGAVVAAPGIYANFVDVWGRSASGIDASPIREAATQQITPVNDGDLRTLTEVITWTSIDYLTCGTPSASGPLHWQVGEGGETSHGFALWFESMLADGISYRTGPGSGDDLYGAAFFPWPEPVVCTAGTTVDVNLRADLVAGSYVWTWHTELTADGRRRSFDQSTFAGGPMSIGSLRSQSPDRQVTVGIEAAVDAEALRLLCQGLRLGEAGAQLRRAFPDRFGDDVEATSHVADLALRYQPGRIDR